MAFQGFRFSMFRRFDLWLFAAIALLPAALWYEHAYQVALQFYPHHFFGAGGVKIMSAAWYLTILKEIATSTLTPILLVFGAGGALITRPRDAARIFHWWLAAIRRSVAMRR